MKREQVPKLVKTLLFVSVAISLSTFVYGEVKQAVPVLNLETKSEFVDQAERISGGATVGVAFVGAGDDVQLKDAYVFLAEPTSSAFEMQLTTVDGRYVAVFGYQPSSALSGWVKLNLPVSRPDVLRGYEINEIAPLVMNSQSGVAYPLRWGRPERAAQLRIYINSEGAKSYFVTHDKVQDKLSTRKCVTASNRSGFKFDRLCDVPLSDVTGENKVEILRKRGAEFGKPLEVKVLVSSPGPR